MILYLHGLNKTLCPISHRFFMSLDKTNDALIKYNKLKSKLSNASMIAECFYHDKSECKGSIKDAHTIQRNGRLSLLTGNINGNEVIYSLSDSIPSERNLIETLKPIGIAKASIFKGFCDYHDNIIFSPIENYPYDQNKDEHNFLHSYRSFAYAYHKRRETVKLYDQPSIIPFSLNQSHVNGVRMGFSDLHERKQNLDNLIASKAYEGLDYLTYVVKDLRIPIAYSNVISPEYTYSNKPFNQHNDPNRPYSHIMLTVLPDKKDTIVILSCFSQDDAGISFLNELSELSYQRLEKVITSLIIARSSNLFFSPDFWNKLGRNEQRSFLQERETHIRDIHVKYDQFGKFWISKFNFFDKRFAIS